MVIVYSNLTIAFSYAKRTIKCQFIAVCCIRRLADGIKNLMIFMPEEVFQRLEY